MKITTKGLKKPLKYKVAGYPFKTPLGGCMDTVQVLVFDETPSEKFDSAKTRHDVFEQDAFRVRTFIAQQFADKFTGLVRSGVKDLYLHSRQIAYIQNYMKLNQEEFANLIGVSPSRISEYIKANGVVKNMKKGTKLSIIDHLLAETRQPGYALSLMEHATQRPDAVLKEFHSLLDQGTVEELKYG